MSIYKWGRKLIKDVITPKPRSANLPYFVHNRLKFSGIDYLDPPSETDQPEFPGQNFVRGMDKRSPAHALQSIRMDRLFFQEFGLIVVCLCRSHHILPSWRRLGLFYSSTIKFFDIHFSP